MLFSMMGSGCFVERLVNIFENHIVWARERNRRDECCACILFGKCFTAFP